MNLVIFAELAKILSYGTVKAIFYFVYIVKLIHSAFADLFGEAAEDLEFQNDMQKAITASLADTNKSIATVRYNYHIFVLHKILDYKTKIQLGISLYRYKCIYLHS